MESLNVSGEVMSEPGYFRFGPEAVCYGQCSSGATARHFTDSLYDATAALRIHGSSVELPFDPRQILDNLRCERYAPTGRGVKVLRPSGVVQSMYYKVRPLLGVSARRRFQRFYFRGWENIPFPKWPVDRTVETLFEQLLIVSMKARNLERVPFIWFWPEGSPSCTMMTHDVETSAGLKFCAELMDLNDAFGIKSSFHIIPERRYRVVEPVLEAIRQRGFEIDVHDLNHDGLLMCDREEFHRRAERINAYGKQFGAQGFRSAVMYRNVDWYDELDFAYDMSDSECGASGSTARRVLHRSAIFRRKDARTSTHDNPGLFLVSHPEQVLDRALEDPDRPDPGKAWPDQFHRSPGLQH